jgi:hypothetical protein
MHCVRGRMVFGSFACVVLSLDMMAMRQMSVMTGLFVFTCFVVLCCRQMVLGSFLMVFRSLAMMFSGLLGPRTFLNLWIQKLKHF